MLYVSNPGHILCRTQSAFIWYSSITPDIIFIKFNVKSLNLKLSGFTKVYYRFEILCELVISNLYFIGYCEI